MTRRNWQVTKRLLILTMLLESKMKEMAAAGVTINALEETQLEIVNLICENHGIKRDHPQLDILVDPIFQYNCNEMGINKCMQLFYQRLDEIRQTRLKEVGHQQRAVENEVG